MQYVVYYVLVLLATEWWLTAEHNKHDDTHGPYVTLRCITAFEHLRRYVVRRTVRLVHYFVWNHAFCQSKIYQFNMTIIVLLVQEEILWLYVPVANAVRVQVTKCIKCLFHY